jgi:hypothetical protein
VKNRSSIALWARVQQAVCLRLGNVADRDRLHLAPRRRVPVVVLRPAAVALQPAARRAEPRAVLAYLDRVHLVVPLHRVARRPLGARRHAAPRQAMVLRARQAAALPARRTRALLALAVLIHFFEQRVMTHLLVREQRGDSRFQVLRARQAVALPARALAVLIHFEQLGSNVAKCCVRCVPHAQLSTRTRLYTCTWTDVVYFTTTLNVYLINPLCF